MTAVEKYSLHLYSTVKSWIFHYFRNKYWTVLIIFLAWMLLFDNNSIIRQVQRRYQIHKLNKEIKYYQKQMVETHKEEKALKKSDAYFEKFVRENYLLKRPNEDLYIFTEVED